MFMLQIINSVTFDKHGVLSLKVQNTYYVHAFRVNMQSRNCRESRHSLKGLKKFYLQRRKKYQLKYASFSSTSAHRRSCCVALDENRSSVGVLR